MAGIQVLQAAPRLLGAGQAQSYLVLAENRDEERTTGGFISGIGLLTLQEGKIMQFDLGDTYRIDDFTKAYPKPPEALKRFMLADYWVARDANWSPDFPTAAQEAQTLYTLSTGVHTQGVIAFNQLAVRAILEIMGAVQVPGTCEPALPSPESAARAVSTLSQSTQAVAMARSAWMCPSAQPSPI